MDFRLCVIELALENDNSTLTVRECSDITEASILFAPNPRRRRRGRICILER